MSEMGMPGSGFFELAKRLGVAGSEDLPATQYVAIAWPEDSDEWLPFKVNGRVRNTCPRQEGRTGTITSWGRSLVADAHWHTEHEPVLKCTYGTECDALVDAEGPIVRWDGLDEELDWFPGQSMGCIEPMRPGELPSEGVIADMERVERLHDTGQI